MLCKQTPGSVLVTLPLRAKYLAPECETSPVLCNVNTDPKNPALGRQAVIRHASQAVETQLLEVLQARQRAILLLP